MHFAFRTSRNFFCNVITSSTEASFLGIFYPLITDILTYVSPSIHLILHKWKLERKKLRQSLEGGKVRRIHSSTRLNDESHCPSGVIQLYWRQFVSPTHKNHFFVLFVLILLLVLCCARTQNYNIFCFVFGRSLDFTFICQNALFCPSHSRSLPSFSLLFALWFDLSVDTVICCRPEWYELHEFHLVKHRNEKLHTKNIY